MKKIVLAILAFTLLWGCSKKDPYQGTALVKADMSGYTGLNDEDHVFFESNTMDFLTRLNWKETFTAYFGFDTCPWCNAVIQILDDTAKEYDQKIFYINTRANGESNNMEIPNYEDLVDQVGQYFSYDADGKRHLYTPFVMFIKDGEVVYTCGVIDDYEDVSQEMTDEQKQKQKEAYESGFQALLESEESNK